jgi:hypothetical protein
MQAGKQRGALPLIRKFNEHSERLLKSAMYVWSTLTSHPRSEDILTDPWTWRTNGEELIREMLMMCMVFLTFALPSSHLEDLFSRIATTHRLISPTYTTQSRRLVSCWKCKTVSATLKRVPVLLFPLSRPHAP